MDKLLQESEAMAKQPACAKCGKKNLDLLEIDGKKYCRPHYINQLRKFRDDLTVKLIGSLMMKSASNPELLTDEDKQLMGRLKDTFRQSRFDDYGGKNKPEKTLEQQISGLPHDELIALLTKALTSKK